MTGAEWRNRMGLDKQPGTKPLKYHNKKTTVTAPDGQTITFDSKAEAEYYGKLLLRKRIGGILDFHRQVSYRLEVNGLLICHYIADFVVIYPDGRTDTLDIKGVETDVFVLKKKLMKACLGIDIILVKK